MMYRFQIQKYILSEVFRVCEPQELLTFEPYLHVGVTFKRFTHFLNKKVSSRPYNTSQRGMCNVKVMQTHLLRKFGIF